MRVVLDTSVLITALRSSNGAAAEVLRLALLQELTVLMDYKLSCEYRDVALREEHLTATGKTIEDIRLLLNTLESIAEPVQVNVRHAPLSQDANDDMILDVAINGGADAMVTNNTKHFRESAKRFKLPLLTPAELLQQIRRKL